MDDVRPAGRPDGDGWIIYKRGAVLSACLFLFALFLPGLSGKAGAYPGKTAENRASNVKFEARGAQMVVTYDLAGPGASNVTVVFKDGPDKVFKTSAESLSGDVGKGISPGKGKTVTWRFMTDYPNGFSVTKLAVEVVAVAAVSKTIKDPAPVEKRQEQASETTELGKKTEGKVNVSLAIKLFTGETEDELVNLTIVAELYPDKAPLTVANFLKYVRDGHYDGTIFHRIIKGFMIQGGGFTSEMVLKSTRPPVKNEADNGLANDRGTLAMARTSAVDSAKSQFFINLVDNEFLNHQEKTADGYGYAVFGKVVEGMDAVDAIAEVKTNKHGRPKTGLVYIESVRVLE